MVKCCIPECCRTYRSVKKNGEAVSFYSMPNDNSKDDRQEWKEVVKSLYPEVQINDKTFICSLHWPKNPPMVSYRGKERPAVPPSVFPSALATTSQKQNVECDELIHFKQLNNVDFEKLKDGLINKKRVMVVDYNAFVNQEAIYVQSKEFFEGLPEFLLKIKSNLDYEAFHMGVKVYIPSLNRNRIYKLRDWSCIEEALRFLNSRDEDHKTKVLQQQIKVMGASQIGRKLHSIEILIRAFEYLCTSRSLYSKLSKDFALPSVKTLSRITSRVSKANEDLFLSKVLESYPVNKRIIALIFDEIFVKKALLYHGGTIFGKAVNNPNELAKSVFGVMIESLLGGATFLHKMLPVVKLNADFMLEELMKTVTAIESSHGAVKVLICDNNRVNQRFFKLMEPVNDKPWLSKNGVFLLFDYVHLLKSIRNNWITDKLKELDFVEEGVLKRAKWAHLEQLFKAERNSVLKLSKLNEVAVYPKPIERQKVSTCLKIFCAETKAALTLHPDMENVEGKDETASFIGLVVKFFKILNVKSNDAGTKHNDSMEEVVSNVYDDRLKFLCSFGDMAAAMKPSSGKRVRQLTSDTSKAIFHTCHGLVDLCKDLLATSHKYVCFGKFTSDLIEKEFSKLRQGSGGTYFITVQQILEKLNIKKASIFLSTNGDVEQIDTFSGHLCPNCSFVLDENSTETFDNLEELENHVTVETKMALVYISGYVTRNDLLMSDDDLFHVTTFYHQKFGNYIDELDRGSLNIPSDTAVQWSIFCFVMFEVVKNRVCRQSLCNIFDNISEYYQFNMRRQHSRILANIFLKNFCTLTTPRTSKETNLKVLKLSDN